jgi:hypothetical protein
VDSLAENLAGVIDHAGVMTSITEIETEGEPDGNNGGGRW